MFRTGFGTFDLYVKRVASTGAREQWLPIDASHADHYTRRGLTVRDAPSWAAQFPVCREVAPGAAVCLSGRFSVAAAFPLQDPTGDEVRGAWLYVVQLRQFFNTYAEQIAEGVETLAKHVEARCEIERAGQHNLTTDAFFGDLLEQGLRCYGHEYATAIIPTANIICAIAYERERKGAGWLDGVRYALDKNTLRFNERAKTDKSIVAKVRSLIADEPSESELALDPLRLMEGQD